MNKDTPYNLGMKDFNDGKVFGCSLPSPVSDIHKAQYNAGWRKAFEDCFTYDRYYAVRSAKERWESSVRESTVEAFKLWATILEGYSQHLAQQFDHTGWDFDDDCAVFFHVYSGEEDIIHMPLAELIQYRQKGKDGYKKDLQERARQKEEMYKQAEAELAARKEKEERNLYEKLRAKYEKTS